MMTGVTAQRWLPKAFWGCTILALAIWSLVPNYVVGWDLDVYKAAALSLRAGHDPYADATAIQRVYHAHEPHPPGTAVPFSYVYSPITLPLVKIVGKLPFVVSGTAYWMLFLPCVLLAIVVGLWSAETEEEKRVFALIAPVAVFFPGLLQQDVFFSGNIAYILYGFVFAAAWWGWTKKQWLPFYVVVFVASCFKAPLLSLVAIPVLSARRQWIPTLVTAALGVAAFAVQPKIWPSLFQSYLTAVDLQFLFNRDFSSSPAGLVANALYAHVPYRLTWAVVYGTYALVIGAFLLYLRGQFLAGRIRLKQWVPVMMLGTILLNPRIMEYDAAPITMMMALVAWRFFHLHRPLKATVLLMGSFFAVINVVGVGIGFWKPVEGFTLVAVFVAGCWTLLQQGNDPRESEVSPPVGFAVAEQR